MKKFFQKQINDDTTTATIQVANTTDEQGQETQISIVVSIVHYNMII